ncbi:MAG: hypothetical protein JNL11_15305 [Bdellovibrionaceae bacterium]|nr:hypothetical protein [Pseudobdellovibrionaceae bacterium]
MFWFFIIAALLVVALVFISRALIRKSQNYSPTPSLNDVNSSTKTFKADLFKLQFTENAESYGEKVSQQFDELENKYSAYLQTLNQKFNPSEMTYDRYLQPVQQVQLSLVENFKKLKDVVVFIGHNAAVIKSLHQKSSDALSVDEKNKLEIQKKYLNHFDELFAMNQKALNELDQLNLSLGQITNSSSDPKQIEYLVKELAGLSERAKKYNLH